MPIEILARQAISEAQHLHSRVGVVGFDIAGPERGNAPRLFKSAFEIARLGRLGLTVHSGEDAPADYVWEAVDRLGAQRIGQVFSLGTGKVAEELEREMHPLDGIDPNGPMEGLKRVERPGQRLTDGVGNLDRQKDAPAFALIRHVRRP